MYRNTFQHNSINMLFFKSFVSLALRFENKHSCESKESGKIKCQRRKCHKVDKSTATTKHRLWHVTMCQPHHWDLFSSGFFAFLNGAAKCTFLPALKSLNTLYTSSTISYGWFRKKITTKQIIIHSDETIVIRLEWTKSAYDLFLRVIISQYKKYIVTGNREILKTKKWLTL